jgi:ABC-type histidine transport system, ATPase component
MTLETGTRNTARTRWRPALLLVFLAQLALAVTPLLEGRDGPDAKAHVEEAGTAIHHVHDEAYCSACTVRHLLASSEVVPPEPVGIVQASRSVAVEKAESFLAAVGSTARSRAPPAEL